MIFLSSSFFTHEKREVKKNPSSSCHIDDTISSDAQITSDGELPRRRCVGVVPSRRRFWCQTTEQSFGKTLAACGVFIFIPTCEHLPWIFQLYLLRASHGRAHRSACMCECFDSAELLLSVRFPHYNKSLMRTASLEVKRRLFRTAFQNGSLESWPLHVLTSWHYSQKFSYCLHISLLTVYSLHHLVLFPPPLLLPSPHFSAFSCTFCVSPAMLPYCQGWLFWFERAAHVVEIWGLLHCQATGPVMEHWQRRISHCSWCCRSMDRWTELWLLVFCPPYLKLAEHGPWGQRGPL